MHLRPPFRLSLAFVVALGAGCALHRPIPPGIGGAEGDTLAHRVMDATGADGWRETGAVQWTDSAGVRYLCDRTRDYVRVVRGNQTTLFDTKGQWGVRLTDGVQSKLARGGVEVNALIADWRKQRVYLEPFYDAFGAGVERRAVTYDDGSRGLHVTRPRYRSTDDLLFRLDETDRPTSCQMWWGQEEGAGTLTHWTAWKIQATGVQIPEVREVEGGAPLLTNVAVGPSVAALSPGPDPFLLLREVRAETPWGPAPGPSTKRRTDGPDCPPAGSL